jgi:N-acetylglucosamine-6-phosphate deacetylase
MELASRDCLLSALSSNCMDRPFTFVRGVIVLEDRLLVDGGVRVVGGRIDSVFAESSIYPKPFGETFLDLAGRFLVPGFVDLHVHGGAGADFMDVSADAFLTIRKAHARHGTTSLLATSTVARHDQLLRFLQLCQDHRRIDADGARVLGAHFYGPYFAREARGCHPGGPVRPPTPDEFHQYLEFADAIVTATVAPELDGAEEFVRACRDVGIRCNAGHSHATFTQVEHAVAWGVRHVDHLFCAMSDRARLRQSQSHPMRGGLLEATLYFDQLTTEVIADGKHLERELLLLAHKIKGPDRLALVTDANRALDMPDGEYWFGPKDGGERILRRDGVGLTLDGSALASGVVGLDEQVRTMRRLTGLPLPEIVRMASLTPARIAGYDREIGSIAPGKLADLVVLDDGLHVCDVFIGGRRVAP